MASKQQLTLRETNTDGSFAVGIRGKIKKKGSKTRFCAVKGFHHDHENEKKPKHG